MDPRCQERAEVIESWILVLEKTEETLMNLEASEDALWGNIYLETHGTVEERKAKTNSDARMINLRKAITEAKREHNKAKRMYDLVVKCGDWEYGTFKIEETVIKRQGA